MMSAGVCLAIEVAGGPGRRFVANPASTSAAVATVAAPATGRSLLESDSGVDAAVAHGVRALKGEFPWIGKEKL